MAGNEPGMRRRNAGVDAVRASVRRAEINEISVMR